MGTLNVPFQIRNTDKRVEKRVSFFSLKMHEKRTSLLGDYTLLFFHTSKGDTIDLNKIISMGMKLKRKASSILP